MVALGQVPELRWYASGLSGVGPWLASLFGDPTAAASAPFSGFYAPARYFVVLLEVFAIVLLACAVAAEYLGSIIERLYSLVSLARAEAEGGQELWTGLIAVSYTHLDVYKRQLIVYTDALDFVLRLYVHRRHTATAREGDDRCV